MNLKKSFWLSSLGIVFSQLGFISQLFLVPSVISAILGIYFGKKENSTLSIIIGVIAIILSILNILYVNMKHV
jgi:uncharacterized membrane protein HdeD (DUF308 family)